MHTLVANIKIKNAQRFTRVGFVHFSWSPKRGYMQNYKHEKQMNTAPAYPSTFNI